MTYTSRLSVVPVLALTLSIAAPAPADSRAVPLAAEDTKPIQVGAALPQATLHTVDGEPVELRSLAGERPLALIFYRGGWCPYCNAHLGELQKAEAELVGLGYRLVAVSADRPEKLRESVRKHELAYTLLSDAGMECAESFGIAFRVDDATIETYKKYGIDLEDASGQTHHILPVPTVALVDTQGVIRFIYSNPDYKVRLSTADLLAAAREVVGSGE